ncbi:MAG: hypothetical protein ACRCSN_07235 [Dermatophilaceae bacterium]
MLAGTVETAVNASWDAARRVGDRVAVVGGGTVRLSSSGLQLALDLLAADGTVLDLSWFGDDEMTLRLGGSFHARRQDRPRRQGRRRARSRRRRSGVSAVEA